jgi:hypothetical protein
MSRFCVILLAAVFGSSYTVQAQSLESSSLGGSLPDAPSAMLEAQTTTPAPLSAQVPSNETEQQRKLREQREEAAREIKEQEKQRIGAIMPDFNVVMSGHAVPISAGQKFNLAFHTVIDPYTIGLAAVVGGGYGEISDNHTGYHWGPAGYFKRFGAAYADAVDGTMIGNGLLPVILKQDPRYYRKIHGTIMSRILYSASTTFVCHGDNGKLQPNVSNVLGNFIAGAISNVYYPSDESGFALTVENASIQTVEGMVGAQLLEFSPDVTDWLHKRHQRKLQAKAQKAATADGQPAPPSETPAKPATPAPATPPTL